MTDPTFAQTGTGVRALRYSGVKPTPGEAAVHFGARRRIPLGQSGTELRYRNAESTGEAAARLGAQWRIPRALRGHPSGRPGGTHPDRAERHFGSVERCPREKQDQPSGRTSGPHRAKRSGASATQSGVHGRSGGELRHAAAEPTGQARAAFGPSERNPPRALCNGLRTREQHPPGKLRRASAPSDEPHRATLTALRHCWRSPERRSHAKGAGGSEGTWNPGVLGRAEEGRIRSRPRPAGAVHL